jgi:hypothetical protein
MEPLVVRPLVLTPRDRAALAQQCERDARRVQMPTPARPRRRHVIDTDLLEECRLEAERLKLPALVTLRQCAVRCFCYDEAPRVSQLAFRIFKRNGLEGRLTRRGRTFVVPSGDALYALRVDARRVRTRR